jgi:hypothetical protein
LSPHQALSFYDEIFKIQIGRAILIGLGLIGVALGAWLWPGFFEYRYAYIAPDFWQSVFRFWPAFLWGMGATGAGVTEEVWYRGVGVFYAMITLVIANWVVGAAGWIFIGIGGICIVLGVVSLFSEDVRDSGGLIVMPIAIAIVAAMMYGIVVFNHDVVYQVYTKLFYPVIDFVTFGLLKTVLYGEHPALLVMGMFAANFWFRNGHSYQGLFGWTNSWFMGCVFIYATLTHGLAVAVMVHILYNALISCVRYLVAKTKARTETGLREVA